MSKSPHQSTVEGERLRKDVGATRRGVQTQIKDERPIGMIALFPDFADLGEEWKHCNGDRLLRSRYPRLARVLSGASDDATFELPALAIAGAGLRWMIWAPPG